MRMFNLLVFDDQLWVGIGGFVQVPTSAKFNEILGKYDQLALQLFFDGISVTGGGQLPATTSIYGSGDGEHFSSESLPINNKPFASSGSDLVTGVASGLV